MKIDNVFIKECETLISKGNTTLVLEKLQTVKDVTGYKNEIIHLESRWKSYSRDKRSGTLSSENESLLNSKINKDILLLIEAMTKEAEGENVVSDLFQIKGSKGTTWRPFTQTYIPLILMALGVWAISFFAYKDPKPVCDHELNLNGNWEIYSKVDNTETILGRAKILHDPCKLHFQLSAALISKEDPAAEVDFSTSIAGFNDGKVVFVYENFEGEIGVCRGIEPSTSSDKFTVHCTDLAGFDKNGNNKEVLNFKRKNK